MAFCSADSEPSDSSSVPSIGMFDSGSGGLAVLQALHRKLPLAHKVYIGDTAFAPYGERDVASVLARCDTIVRALLERGATLIVIACNTATAIAIDSLRTRWPATSFVGVEPGIKPAMAGSPSRRIAIMATSATVESARTRRLIERHAEGGHVHLEACPGLATAIERGVVDGLELNDALNDVLRPHCDRLRKARVDTVVLGCTHYPIVASIIRQMLGADIRLIDTSEAVADRARALWLRGSSPRSDSVVKVLGTGSLDTLSLVLRRCGGLEGTKVEAVEMP